MQGTSGKWLGKLPTSALEEVLKRAGGSPSPSTILGPAPGEDAAVVDLGCCELVMHVDPITEAGENAGWLAVHVASNDIAVTGARPRWILLTILAREGSGLDEIKRLAEDAGRAAREIGAEIVGGHTEVTPGLSKTIVQAAAVGYTCKGCSVSTSGAKPGDLVVQVKPVALEGTAIIASDFGDVLRGKGIPDNVIERARGFYRRISVVEEALLLAERRLVSSMHDPTEGGLIGGLVEMARASGSTFIIYSDRIIVEEETRVIVEALGVDPLKLISSGTLIATIPKEYMCKVESLLEAAGVEYSIIGEVAGWKGAYLKVVDDGVRIEYNEVPMDEITRVIEKYAQKEE